ncbi:hypothetical protein [Scandinavium goeteborgense]|uniref:hypothetical protein n=1 Tax=Scandinavium goeteborgense TaxID=1851514 RepID=UPI001573E32E|nr:hypothetical protein [Scandinavium goeteborgense]QKN80790.1 hypothetical protein A8O29_005625 [Scandinavium goeteborgense]
MSGFYIDTEALRLVKAALGATESQMVAAFYRALKETANQLYKESVAMMFSETGAKNKKLVQRRVRRFTKKVSGNQPGSGKIWFGLSDMPVSSLKGRIKSPRVPLERQRDSKGRFLPYRGSRGATFIPRSPNIKPESFINSFAATLRNTRSIWIRTEKGHVTEARVPVNTPVLSAIDSDLFAHAGDTLMERFTKDLRGRVAGNVHLNGKGKKI